MRLQGLDTSNSSEELFGKAFYRTLLHAIPSPVFVMEEDVRIVDCNEICQSLFRKTGEKFFHECVGNVIHCLHAFEVPEGCGKSPACRQCLFRGSVNKALAGKKLLQQPVEMDVSVEDGVSQMTFLLSAVPLDHEDHRFALVILNDITAHCQKENQLRHTQKMEVIGRLAAGIAHEINTPTQYIRNNIVFLENALGNLRQIIHLQSETLKEMLPPDRLGKCEADLKTLDMDFLIQEIPVAIEQSLHGIDRVTKIVRSVKEFSHPDSQTKEHADINAVIEDALTISGNEWNQVADVVTHFDPDLPSVICIPGAISQALLNMIVNAAQTIAELTVEGELGKGTITCSTRRDGEWVEIRIADTGAGIPDALRERVFDPFFTTREVGMGTGQGLAIAHTIIVQQHRGSIVFETEPGKGTIFIIRLPLNRNKEPWENTG